MEWSIELLIAVVIMMLMAAVLFIRLLFRMGAVFLIVLFGSLDGCGNGRDGSGLGNIRDGRRRCRKGFKLRELF